MNFVISDLNGEEIVGTFIKKTNYRSKRAEKVIKQKRREMIC